MSASTVVPYGPAPSRRRGVVLAGVLLLHLALLVVLRTPPCAESCAAVTPGRAPAASQWIRVAPILVPATRVPFVPTSKTSTDARSTAAAPSRRPARATGPADSAGRVDPAKVSTARSGSATAPPADAPRDPDGPSAAAITAEAPARPASAPEVPPSLLDTEATRRAIRFAARAPSLRADAARASNVPEPPGTDHRLAEAVKSTGKGDCMKGDFFGSGMGLISLPFLAAAAVNGDCAK